MNVAMNPPTETVAFNAMVIFQIVFRNACRVATSNDGTKPRCWLTEGRFCSRLFASAERRAHRPQVEEAAGHVEAGAHPAQEQRGPQVVPAVGGRPRQWERERETPFCTGDIADRRMLTLTWDRQSLGWSTQPPRAGHTLRTQLWTADLGRDTALSRCSTLRLKWGPTIPV